MTTKHTLFSLSISFAMILSHHFLNCICFAFAIYSNSLRINFRCIERTNLNRMQNEWLLSSCALALLLLRRGTNHLFRRCTNLFLYHWNVRNVMNSPAIQPQRFAVVVWVCTSVHRLGSATWIWFRFEHNINAEVISRETFKSVLKWLLRE